MKLINKLRRILSKDPDALVCMKMSIDTLREQEREQDKSITIEPEDYNSAQTIDEFFKVMKKYWNCYDDHALLKMVIEETENKEANSELNAYLCNRNRDKIISMENCSECPFQSPCGGSSSDSTTAFTEMGRDGNGLGDSLQQIPDTQNRFSVTSLPQKEDKSLQHFHYHPGSSNALPRNRVPLAAKAFFNQINGRMHDRMKGIIATVLKMSRPGMSLWGIYPGCCVIVWHVSKEVAAGIKRIQLSHDDQEMLLQCGILTLSCDNKCLFTFPQEKLVSICLCVLCIWWGGIHADMVNKEPGT